MTRQKTITKILTAICVSLIVGCDGISGTGGPSRVEDNNDKQTPNDGQAVLGPIVGATVTIRDVEDINTVACSATTTDNSDFSKAGAIHFSAPCIFRDHLYLVAVTGGNDIDYNDDGTRDTTPTANTGEFRALLSGDQLLQNNWKTNALTESVYQAVQYAAQTGDTDLVATVDQIAQQLIRQDLNGDAVIDHRDIALWHPVANAGDAKNNDKLRFSTQLIHHNLNRTLTDIPDAESLSGHIDTLAPARQVLTHNNDLLVTTDTALLIYHYDNGASTLLSSLALGWIYDMAVLGDSLYVALGENGIAQIDIANNIDPHIVQRWPNATTRLATLQDRVVFSYIIQSRRHALAEINGTSVATIATIETSSSLSKLETSRGLSSDESARNGLLKTVGNTVYWSPEDSLRRFVLENGQWRQQSALLAESEFPNSSTPVIDDVEIYDNLLYVLNRAPENSREFIYLFNSGTLASASPDDEFDMLLKGLTRKVDIFDVSNAESPTAVSSKPYADIEAIRRWDGEVVALGENDISVRYPADLHSKLSLRLPATFSGFYPAKGLARIDDTLIVAAKENGLLFLKTSNIPIKKFYGRAYNEGPVVNSRVVVTQRPQNKTTCDLNSNADGVIEIPEICVGEDAYYDVTVIGGEQIVDGQSAPFLGTMHVTMPASSFLRSDWFVSPLTEIAWRTFEKSATREFDDIDDAYKRFVFWWLQNDDKLFREAHEIWQWNPETEKGLLKFTADQWQLATQALKTATWTDQTSARLWAPFADFYAFNESINGIVATDHLTFVAHPHSVDVLAAGSDIKWLQNLPAGADEVFASDDIFVAIDRENHSLRSYRTDVNGDVTQTHEIFDSVINNFSHFCAKGDLLFSFTYEPATDSSFNTFINAWSIADNKLEKIDSLQIATREYTTLNCSSNTVIVGTNYRIDIIKFTNNRLALTDGVAPLTGDSITDIFFDGTQVYLSVISDFPSFRFIYATDASGHLSLTKSINLRSNPDFSTSGYLDVDNSRILAALRYNTLSLVNTATQEDIADVPIPQFTSSFVLSQKQTVWTWDANNIWTIDAAKILAN